MKRFAVIAALAVAFSTFAAPSAIGAAVYFQDRTERAVSKGAVLTESRRVVDGGLLNVYALTVPADDPYITLNAVSSDEYGLKEPTSKLLEGAGALAGVNGDFFGTAGAYSIPLGVEASASGWSVADNAEKQAGNAAGASFIVPKDGSPFMDFITTEVRLTVGGEAFAPVRAMNKTADIPAPVIMTKGYISDTASLDKRFAGLVKVIVVNGRISRVSDRGETVDLPDGAGNFIVLMTGEQYDKHGGAFTEGAACGYAVTSNVDFSKVQAAISGGGFLLVNGKAAAKGEIVSKDARQPRTAIGISKDKSKVIMLVIDGRGDSVGATNDETAAIMLEFGAWTAIHLDGGGSSTMAAYDAALDGVSVVNSPSDGVQRKVINALGLFVTAPVGGVAAIAMSGEGTQLTGELELGVYGTDAYGRRFQGALNGVTYQSEQAKVEGGKVIAAKAGEVSVTAKFGAASVTKVIRVIEAEELLPAAAMVRPLVGVPVQLAFTARDGSGYTAIAPPSRLEYAVYPEDLGLMSADGQFLATRTGRGYIECAYVKPGGGRVVYNLPVNATVELSPSRALGGAVFSGYPATVAGEVFAYDNAAELYYQFAESGQTQAAYVNLNDKANALGFRVSIVGDGSGHWVRAKATDGLGKEFVLDVAANLDFDGAKEFDVWYPAGVARPVTLNQIYVVSLGEGYASSHNITFRDFMYFEDVGHAIPEVAVPESTKRDGAAGLAKWESLKGSAVAYVTMSGVNGGYAKTNAKQYAALAEAAKTAGAVVVRTDKNPLSLSKTELALFEAALRPAAKEGRAYVVYSTGREASAFAKDGIWYIDKKQ